MGWDGSGNYNRVHNFSADASAGINILAARMDAEINDIASAFTRVWTRDGQNTPTQDLPMGGRKFVNVGAPTSVSNFMRAREFIENIPIFMQDAESSADRISVSSQYFTSVSANQAPADGTKIMVRVNSDKSSAVLYLDGHSANVEFQDGNRAANAMVSGGIYELTYSSVDTAWKLPNPSDGRPPAEIAAGVTIAGHVYTVGNIYRYKTGSLAVDATNDWSAAIQAAVDVAEVGGPKVIVPGTSGFYRCATAIAIGVGVTIEGDGYAFVPIRFYGCNGFDVAAGVAGVKIVGLELFSLSAAGAADPKTHQAINVEGTSGSNCNYVTVRDCYLRGWSECVNFEYTWSSVIDNVTTINCTTGVRLFGQSVNNEISDSHIVANTGTYCVRLVKDGATVPEGLMVSNTLLSSATYGIHSDGMLGLQVSNCVIDLCGDTAIDLTNCPGTQIGGSWLYAANYGVRWQDLGVLVDQAGAGIDNCRVEVTASGGISVKVGANNQGITINGGGLICGAAGASRNLYVETNAGEVTIAGTALTNPSANTSIFAGNALVHHRGLIGNVTITYNSVAGFTGTLTGISGADPTLAVIASIDDDYIDLEIPETIGVSDTTACTITGMPAAYRPARVQYVSGVPISDNSVAAIGRVSIGTDGVITLYNGLTSTTFTGANNKGIYATNIRYRRF